MMMKAQYRSTDTPGVYVRHRDRCPAVADRDARCRCKELHGKGPTWRGKRRNPTTKKSEYSRVRETRAEVLTWLGGTVSDAPVRGQRIVTLGELGDEWLRGAKAGRIRKRRGSGGYSADTLRSYEDSWLNVIKPEYGDCDADALDEREWQAFVDRLADEGKSQSRIANLLAVVSAIYGWAAHPTRGRVKRNYTKGVEKPPGDGKPRTRVVELDEVERVLRPLRPADQLPYAIALGAGLRRSEINRLDWSDVQPYLDDGVLHVGASKSEAGTDRWPPMFNFLRDRLRWEWNRQGRPTSGRVVQVSVTSSKLAARADEAWRNAGVERMTLHDGRHTYASHLMAAGVTLKEHQDFMGHADLQMTARYAKRVKPADHAKVVNRLDAYATG